MKGKPDSKEFEELSKMFSLIPLEGKRPIEKNWQEWCEKPRPYNRKEFEGRNAGIPCGPVNGILVLDVDDPSLFYQTAQENGWERPETRVHLTGSGKLHFLFQYPKNGKRYGCRSFKNLGFDIRGIGGQIVAPGSVHPDTGERYSVHNDREIAPAPEWLLKLAAHEQGGSYQKSIFLSENSEWNGDLDALPISLPVKKLILKGEPKGSRSEALFSVVQSLLRAGISEQTVKAVLERYPIGEKYREKGLSRDRWLHGEILRARVKMTAGTNGPRGKTPKALTLAELRDAFNVKTKWLWRKHIPMGQPIILNGREGIGKTTIAMVAAKEILQEHKAGSVVWLATEGKVLDTVEKMKDIGLTQRFYVGQKSDGTFKFNFLLKADTSELNTILTCVPKPVLAVFVDSIRGMSPLGDNDDKIGGVMHQVNALVCDKFRAALIYIDHWGKGKKDDILDRNVGTTAKTAAVSAVISVLEKTKYIREITAAKSNIGEIPEITSIKAGGQILIRQPSEETVETMTMRAEAFLLELGAQKKEWAAKKVYRLAEEQKISKDILKKVKKTLAIRSEKSAPRDGWTWSWPP